MRQRATMPAALPTSREEALKPTRSRPTTRLQGLLLYPCIDALHSIVVAGKGARARQG